MVERHKNVLIDKSTGLHMFRYKSSHYIIPDEM